VVEKDPDHGAFVSVGMLFIGIVGIERVLLSVLII
jgi:hypothetical protein